MFAHLRENEPAMVTLAHRVERRRGKAHARATATGLAPPEEIGADDDAEAAGAAPGRVGDADGTSGAGSARRTTIADRKRAAAAADVPLQAATDDETGPATNATAGAAGGQDDDVDDVPRTATGRPIHPSLTAGPRNQPRRLPRSRR